MARRLAAGARLVLATHNAGKLREIAALLALHRADVVSAGVLGLPEPVESAQDFVSNARIKALAAASASGLPALADDSGLCVAALGGAPGVLSARWAIGEGGGAAKDFGAAMARVHRELGDAADRRAWFVAALCLGWPDGHTDTFLGRAEGNLAWPPRGDRGFGYDPMFVPYAANSVSSALTYGEMDPVEKHAISHRARAFEQFLAACLGDTK
jgi:XTP/dITP diphosphohydrolase